MLDYLPFIEGYSIVQLAPPNSFIGKNLIELDLINRFGVQVIAIKELVPENVIMIPTGRFVVKHSDILVILGPDEALAELQGNPNKQIRLSNLSFLENRVNYFLWFVVNQLTMAATSKAPIIFKTVKINAKRQPK